MIVLIMMPYFLTNSNNEKGKMCQISTRVEDTDKKVAQYKQHIYTYTY